VTILRLRRSGWLSRSELRKWLTTAPLYDVAAVALFAALVILAVVTFESYAVSNDEPVQQRYGELIVSYYRSGFTDPSLFSFGNLYLYGGLFDVGARLLENVIRLHDIYDVRHVLCAFIGIGGIVAAWATARLVASPRAGLIAACALALCGPWYGSMFNHTKDIPFGAAMIGATYFLLRTSRELPRPRLSGVVGFGLLLGGALGMRVLGLLMIGYAGIAVILHMRWDRSEQMRDRLAFFSRSAIALAPAFAVGYMIMVAAWPWAALSPLNPVRGLVDFGEFHYHIRTLLAGELYQMGDVPRWYVPAYLLIKLPLVTLVGAALALVAVLIPIPIRGGDRPCWRPEMALLIFMALFPVACEFIDHGPAFTGLRHFLFVVPIFAVLAGIGFDWLMNVAQRYQRGLAFVVASVVAAQLAGNAMLLVELHPYEYLYYNPLVGGLQGASGHYATDYWGNIMPEAVHNLQSYVAKLDEVGGADRRYTVAVCGERAAFEDEASPRLEWVQDWQKAEFFIAPTHMNCDRALDGKIIATISRMGVAIGVVKDRRAIMQQDIARKN
jgi:dolichyl-phosphate-mannose-protein mannosyltransferase